MQASTIVLLGVIGIIMGVNYYIKNRNVIELKSSIDGRSYRIADGPDRQEAVDILASINTEIIKFVEFLRSNPDENIQRICKNYNPDTFGENLDYKSYQAYTVNKGSQVVICIRDKDGKLIKDKNTLVFVMIHELSHIMTPQNGHPPIFWENMGVLLKEAEKCGVYNVVDYSKTPVEFCGVLIDKTPYRF